jgi:hypothetical protein
VPQSWATTNGKRLPGWITLYKRIHLLETGSQ